METIYMFRLKKSLIKKWWCVIMLVVFAGCQKGIESFTDPGTGSGTGTSSGIVGIWKFDSLSANTQTTNEYTDMDSDFKSITYSNYTSKNNAGTVTFNADSTYSSSNINYSVSTTANAYNYENGVLTDSTAQTFRFSLVNYNATGTYELIGSDSIYFSQGFISTSASAPTQSTPSGGKLSLSGNTLTLTQTLHQDTTLEAGGIPYRSIISVESIITLTKQ